MKRRLHLVHAVVLAFIAVVAACTDPVQSENEDSIPPDDGPENELHYAGEWCTACHSENGGAPEFSVAGTVYVTQGGETPAVGATVAIVDAAKKTLTRKTNAVGNFYAKKEDFDPTYPLTVSINYQGGDKLMNTVVRRDGGCGRCHAHASTGSRFRMPRVYATPSDQDEEAAAKDAGTDAAADAAVDAAAEGGQ